MKKNFLPRKHRGHLSRALFLLLCNLLIMLSSYGQQNPLDIAMNAGTQIIPCFTGCNGAIDELDKINCDMLETGITVNETFKAVVWSGLVPNSGTMPSCGFWVQYDDGAVTPNIDDGWIDISASYTGASNPDIVIAKDWSGTPKTRIATVFEYQNNIYVRVDELTNYTTTPMTITNVTTRQLTISNDAHNPHIDMLIDDGSNNTYMDMKDAVIVWHELDGGVYKVKATTGDIFAGTPFGTYSVSTIATGMYPDVAAVSYASSGPDTGYITYVSAAETDLYLAGWDVSTGGTKALATFESSVTEVSHPRIEGWTRPLLSAGAPVIGNVLCAVVANYDNGSNYESNIYFYERTSTTTVTTTNSDIASDHNGSGFGTYNFDAIMPAISFVGLIDGETASSTQQPGQDYYSIAFYADDTFYVTSMDKNKTFTNDYKEGHSNILSATFSMSDKPPLAICNCSNSGHGVFLTYFQGAQMEYNDGGTTYSFKPGKTTGVETTDKEDVHIYPNPVSDRLRISNVDEANYVLVDVTGKTLSEGTFTRATSTVDVTMLEPGTYFIIISKDSYTDQVKFVKN